jgi:hypothetical protein
MSPRTISASISAIQTLRRAPSAALKPARNPQRNVPKAPTKVTRMTSAKRSRRGFNQYRRCSAHTYIL